MNTEDPPSTPSAVRGRGAAGNPANRFERLHVELDPEVPPEERPDPKTLFLIDRSASLITYNDSPDLSFDASINPYRGCEHGCIYCYARPTHEYLGFSAGLDFESRILVKEHAPELLRAELMKPSWKPQLLAMSGVTDPYQPVERKLGLARRCLEVLVEFRNPVGIVTKNHTVTRDVDLLAELAKWNAVIVYLSITTLDRDLATRLEPRASLPQLRLEAIRRLSERGVPVGVLTAPLIPGLTDHEIPALLTAAAEHGARFASYSLVRLPHGVSSLFQTWLQTHYPGKAAKVLSALQSVRGGKLSDSEFGSRLRGEGPAAERIRQFFEVSCRRVGITPFQHPRPTAEHFRRPGGQQMEMGLFH